METHRRARFGERDAPGPTMPCGHGFEADARMDLDMGFRRAEEALHASKDAGRRRISARELA